MDSLGQLSVARMALAMALGCGSPPPGEVNTLAGFGEEGFADGAGADARFGPPGDVVVDSVGTLYVADTFNAAIRRITADGTVSTIAGGTEGFADGIGTAAQFHLPFGLALDGDNTLYVADAFNDVIRRVDLTTFEVETVAGVADEEGHLDGAVGTALFSAPFDVDVEDGTGRLWVVDTDNDAIRLVDLDAGEVFTLAGGRGGVSDGRGEEAAFNGPAAIVCDGSGGAWVSDRNSNTIRHVSSEGEVTTALGVPLRSGFEDGLGSAALMRRPAGLAPTPDGSIVFADQHNNVLRLFIPGEGTRLLAGTQYDSSAVASDRIPDVQDGSSGSAQLRDPRGVAVSSDGDVFFTDLYSVRALRGAL